jgi:uncharacterized membrane protein
MADNNLHHKRAKHLIRSFEYEAEKNRTLGVKAADFLSSKFGTLAFLLLNAFFFIFWIFANYGKIPGVPVFDPHPFILLTMIVSLEAIMLSIIVLISQNRQGYINRLRQELDMQVNLISERETSKILELFKIFLEKNNTKINDEELDEMIKKTDVSYIERQLRKQLDRPTQSADAVIKEIEESIGKQNTP